MADQPAITKSPFSTYDLEKAKKLIANYVTAALTSSQKFFQGDHWQDGAGWIGPAPEINSAIFKEVLARIQKQFVSKNAIAEVVGRHADSVLARANANWFFIPRNTNTIDQESTDVPPADGTAESAQQKKEENSPEHKLIQEITPKINDWWNNRQVIRYVRQATERLLYGGRGSVRLFIPQGRLVEGAVTKQEDLEKALDMIYIDSPDPLTSVMITDPLSMDKANVYVYTKQGNDNLTHHYFEICYIEPESKMTIIRFITDDPEFPLKDVNVAIDLKGQNVVFEMSRQPLVTESIMQNQKLLNLSLTMMGRNVVLGGFLERVILSAQVPGKFEKQDDGTNKYIPEDVRVGAGITTILAPLVYEDEDGKKTISNPDIRYRDPVSVQTFSDTKREAYTCILEDTEQTHMIIAGDAFASGEARIQARANFATSLLKTKPEVDSLIAWVINTALTMAAAFVNSGNKFDTIKAVSDVKPDTGPLTPEEKKIVIEMYKTGLISRESTMVILGNDNPDEEIKKIEVEKKITTPIEKALILTALSKTGWKLAFEQLPEVDHQILGISPRDVTKYKDQLKFEAELSAPSGGNSGPTGGSPQGSTNQPGSQSPGPSSTTAG